MGVLALLGVTVGPWCCLRLWRARKRREETAEGEDTMNPVANGDL